VEYLAYHDGLTGLPNRSMFSKLLGQSIGLAHRHGRSAAVAFLDLDRFKQINDTLGHEAGDELLKEVALRLRGCVRDSDTVARLGGDEFGLILWNLGEGDAASKAWALEAAITEAAIEWEGETLAVGASIGFVMIGPGDELATVLAKADHAMYARKAARKGSRLPHIR
jgi:diguanylate cyclase (GGDEF)-like protein